MWHVSYLKIFNCHCDTAGCDLRIGNKANAEWWLKPGTWICVFQSHCFLPRNLWPLALNPSMKVIVTVYGWVIMESCSRINTKHPKKDDWWLITLNPLNVALSWGLFSNFSELRRWYVLSSWQRASTGGGVLWSWWSPAHQINPLSLAPWHPSAVESKASAEQPSWVKGSILKHFFYFLFVGRD